MSVEDFRINATVRQILARSWVDLIPLRFGAVGRTVYFHGRFEKRGRTSDPAQEPWERAAEGSAGESLVLLEAVEKEIRREALVVDVVFRLDNFRKIQGKWIATE